MDNNDILRRLRYTFNLSDSEMIATFASGDYMVTRAQVSDWLKKEDAELFVALNDQELATFLNGLITEKRGKKEGVQPVAEKILNNNIVFRKLRIALNLKEEDILAMLESVGVKISKHELSAFFRGPEQRQFQVCQDQMLRNFLKGLQLKFRPISE